MQPSVHGIPIGWGIVLHVIRITLSSFTRSLTRYISLPRHRKERTCYLQTERQVTQGVIHYAPKEVRKTVKLKRRDCSEAPFSGVTRRLGQKKGSSVSHGLSSLLLILLVQDSHPSLAVRTADTLLFLCHDDAFLSAVTNEQESKKMKTRKEKRRKVRVKVMPCFLSLISKCSYVYDGEYTMSCLFSFLPPQGSSRTRVHGTTREKRHIFELKEKQMCSVTSLDVLASPSLHHLSCSIQSLL